MKGFKEYCNEEKCHFSWHDIVKELEHIDTITYAELGDYIRDTFDHTVADDYLQEIIKWLEKHGKVTEEESESVQYDIPFMKDIIDSFENDGYRVEVTSNFPRFDINKDGHNIAFEPNAQWVDGKVKYIRSRGFSAFVPGGGIIGKNVGSTYEELKKIVDKVYGNKSRLRGRT